MFLQACIFNGGYCLWLLLCVIRIIRKCSITSMAKAELGDISGGGQCTENAAWWRTQRIKKATKAEKDAFMTWQLSG